MSKHIVITGASSGIGLELTKRYIDQGHRVSAIVRRVSPELAELNVSILEGIDLTQDSSYQLISKHFEDSTIDLLINNAGIFLFEDFPLSEDNISQIRNQFEINTLAPLRVVDALLKNLKRGAKVAMITSRMGSIADNSSGGYLGYRMSKCALNMGAMSLSKTLEKVGVCIGIFHPGYVKTKMTSFQGEITPEESSIGLVASIANLSMEDNCGFWHVNGEELPW